MRRAQDKSFTERKKCPKNMTWPFRAYLPVLAPALMLLLPTSPAPLPSTHQLLTHFPKKHLLPFTKTHIFLTRLTTTSITTVLLLLSSKYYLRRHQTQANSYYQMIISRFMSTHVIVILLYLLPSNILIYT
jgi:hypothetical protein